MKLLDLEEQGVRVLMRHVSGGEAVLQQVNVSRHKAQQ